MIRITASLLFFGFAATLHAQTVDPPSVLGDTTMPSPDDVSQNFPYGITGKTPPSLIKVNYEGQEPYHKHRINLRIFQGCPQVEISDGGRLWATWFGSNVRAERAPYHKDQFSVISTSADDGKTWKEVFVFDPSELFGSGASDPLLWKDPKGNIRFIGHRNIDFKGEDEFASSAWEFTMLDPENEHTAWDGPRLLGNKNISVMKPLLFPDGTVMRSMDDFQFVGRPDKVRIRFLKEGVDGKPMFVSELPVDNDAGFAEQMPIIRKDGSLFTFYRARNGQKFAESFDGGQTWKLGGYYPAQFSINTKCILKTIPSGSSNSRRAEGPGFLRDFWRALMLACREIECAAIRVAFPVGLGTMGAYPWRPTHDPQASDSAPTTRTFRRRIGRYAPPTLRNGCGRPKASIL